MKNKLFVFSTALVLALGLTACGEKAPTAEELVANCMPNDKSISAEMSLNLDANMSMAELGSDATMDMGVGLDADVMGDDDTFYMDGKVKVNFFGFTQEEAAKSYAVTTDKEVTKYQYDEETDSWTYTVEEKNNSNGVLDISEYEFEDLVLQETTKEDVEYIVTAKISSNSFDAFGNMSMDEMIGSEDTDDMNFDVTLTFDKKTKYLTSIKMEVKDYEADGLSVGELSVEIKNIEWTDDDISVPRNVLKNATEASSDVIGGYDDDFSQEAGSESDFDFDFEFEEETFEESESYESSSESSISGPETTVDGVEIRISENAKSYGGKHVYIMGVNTSNEDKSVYVELTFTKNDVVVETSGRYLDIEAETYNIEDIYISDEYDDIKYTVEENQVWDNLLGKDIDIDYIVDADNEKIYGTITNNTQDTLSYPEVKFVVFNENKYVVYFQETYVEADTLSPGESSTFETYIDYDEQIRDFTFFVVADEK